VEKGKVRTSKRKKGWPPPTTKKPPPKKKKKKKCSGEEKNLYPGLKRKQRSGRNGAELAFSGERIRILLKESDPACWINIAEMKNQLQKGRKSVGV